MGDALHKVLLTKNKEHFSPRIDSLVSTETMAEEQVPFAEMIARGLLLCDDALKWQGKYTPILQEKAVEVVIDGHTFWGFPDLYASREEKKILIDYKLSYDKYSDFDAIGELMTFFVYRRGLSTMGYTVNEQYVASMIIRDRKERYSARTKTPLTEIVMVPVPMEETQDAIVQATIVDIANLIEKHQMFPATGIRHGVCSWCPMSQRILKERPFCHMPDEILKELSQTSLQRASLEKWRDEI